MPKLPCFLGWWGSTDSVLQAVDPPQIVSQRRQQCKLLCSFLVQLEQLDIDVLRYAFNQCYQGHNRGNWSSRTMHPEAKMLSEDVERQSAARRWVS